MGIRGLTTYIANRSDYYFEDFVLQNTDLVIDGWSLSSQLYSNIAKCNCTFGGDYDQFANCVAQFFQDLLKCQVRPIVLLDGGWEDKKKATVHSRAKDKLYVASIWKLTSQHNSKFFPLLLADVFKNVMKKLNIKFAMCPMEADDCIAAAARVLQCPVLSYDSDFFIYGTMYIPFNTLDKNITKNKLGWFKRCKIYRIEKLLNRFNGLDASLLPLASILLGNDYIKKKTFSEFFNKMKLAKVKRPNVQQRKIATTFKWLKNYSLNSAVGIVLKSIPELKRKKILYTMEIIINSYSTLTTYMLEPLGLSQFSILEKTNNQYKPFKFDESVVHLENNPKTIEDDEKDMDISDTDDDNEDEEDTDKDGEEEKQEEEKEKGGEEEKEEEEREEEEEEEEHEDDFNTQPDLLASGKFAESVPEWFMKEHLAGNFPPYFVNMITHRVYIIPTQIEDISLPSAMEISIPIITAIYSLMIPKGKSHYTLELMIREKKHFVRRILKVEKADLAFEELRDLPISKRREMIDKVLGIDKEDKLDELPEAWRLYVATIIYWMKQNSEPEKTRIHFTCLLAGMLIGIIEKHTGPRKSRCNFEKKFSNEIARLETLRKSENKLKNFPDQDLSITEALEEVTEEDCIVVLRFFINNFQVNDRLYSNLNKFSIGIVHAFAQFQSCLRHSMHLNTLLGCPYSSICPNESFNGTLLYNLYTNFMQRNDVVAYIERKLEFSPRLFRVFKLLNNKVIDILGTVLEDKTKCSKRRRNKNRKKKQVDDEEEYVTAESDFESPEKSQYIFYDPQNPFSVLTVS